MRITVAVITCVYVSSTAMWRVFSLDYNGDAE